MYRTRDWGGMALAHLVSRKEKIINFQTILLIIYGAVCANKFTIIYWYYTPHIRDQFIQGVPLTGWGLWYFVTFNTLCCLSLIAHLRASFTNPGVIPVGFEAPFIPDNYEVKYCEKQNCATKKTWKPTRAHHCRECGCCIFKVRIQILICLDGPSLSLD